METRIAPKWRNLPQFIWFLVAALISISTELEPWAMIGICTVLTWRIFFDIPKKWVTGALALGVFGLVFSQFGSFWGRDPATHFLSLLTAVKILEYREQRDERFLFLLGLFIIVSKFLFSIDLFVFIFQILVLYFYLQSYLALHTKLKFHNFLIRQMIFSMPLTIGLFIFFPRLNYNFPTFDQPGRKVGFSGFSDKMSPGDVSQVIQSDDLVLRAKINNSIVTPENLYWRGEVLEWNAGFSWRRNAALDSKMKQYPVSRSLLSKENSQQQNMSRELIEYQVVLEPHGQSWIFSLDRPLHIEADLVVSDRDYAGVFQYQYPIKRRLSYKGSANIESFIDLEKQTRFEKFIETNQPKADTLQLENLLQLEPLTSEMQDVVAQFKKSIFEKNKIPFDQSSRLQRIKEVLNFYQTNNFTYTLSPSEQSETVGDFLIRNKQGYCEHYSSSFVILARALQVPSRIVVGYYGGEYNSYGDFWKVTQKNAHAWAEVLLESGKWLRVDPTSVIDGGGSLLTQASTAQTRRQNETTFVELWNEFQLTLDVINFQWTTFLLEYDLENQQEIFSLVVQYFQNIALIFAAILILIFLFRYFQKALRQQGQLQKINGLYLEYSRLTKRPPHLGPMEWHERVKEKHPEIEEASSDITLAFIRFNYLPLPQLPRNLAGLRYQLEEIRDFYKSERKNSIPFIKK